MRGGRVFLGGLASLIVAGCSGSTDGGGPNAVGPDGGGATGSVELHPPANIDISLCKTVAHGSDAASLEACGTCCTKGGFSSATFYGDLCVCGMPRPDDNGETVCATETATNDVCNACCTAANFNGESFIGDPINTCTCSDKFDRAICASVNGADPTSACTVCCLDAGYISSAYEGYRTRTCTCSSGF